MNISTGQQLELISLDNLLNLNIWQILKWPLLLLFLIYLAFAFIVVRQVGLMSRTLNGALDLPVKMIAWLHLLVSFLIFVLALVIL